MADPVCPRLSALAADAARGGRRRRWRAAAAYRRDRRPAILDPRRKPALPAVGRRRDRHDRHARGQARPRGRAALRLGRHGHRLRLLARRVRAGRRRRDRRPAPRQCRRPRGGWSSSWPAACRRARALADRHQSRLRPDHRAATRAIRRCWRSSTPSAGASSRSRPPPGSRPGARGRRGRSGCGSI